MARKEEKLGFEYDEHTSVPTFEEISSVMPKFLRGHKKHHVVLFFSLILIVLLTSGGFVSYKALNPEGTISVTAPFKGMTGFIVNDVNYSDEDIYGIQVSGIPISLQNEEEELKTILTETCEEEKRQVRVDTKLEREDQCQDEVSDLKEKYEEEIKDLEDQIEELQDKYDSCKKSLNSCQDG